MSAILKVVPTHHETYGEAVEAFSRLPFFPDAHEWKEFITPYQNIGKESPFAITLQKGPDPGLCSSGRSSEHTFFGILTSRSDEKLGRLCFGPESEEFGGRDPAAGRAAIFIQDDGFDEKFLKVRKMINGVSTSTDPYKVTAMDTRFKLVMSKLARYLERVAGSYKESPNQVLASDLAKIRDHLGKFLPLCGDLDQKIGFELIQQTLDTRINLRRVQVERELSEIQMHRFEKLSELRVLQED